MAITNGSSILALGGKDSLWFTELIYSQFIVRFNWELGAAFGFLLLFLSSVIVWAALRLSGQSLEKQWDDDKTMIPTIPRSPAVDWIYKAYIALFFLYLAPPLIVVAVFGFNDSQFPSLPWKGFTWD